MPDNSGKSRVGVSAGFGVIAIVSNVRRMPFVGIVIMACIIACGAQGARALAGNIFDDDWIPPKPAVPPQAAPAQPPPAVPTPPAPATNPAAPSPDPQPAPQPAPAPEPAARRPIPGKLEQARSRGLLKEAFAGQLKDRSIAGRRKLAQALLDEVPKTADNPSDEYVLLGGAIDASKDAGALDLCFQAVDTMASQYKVDGLSIKTDAALKINLRGDSPATTAANAQVALALIDPLLAAEDFSTAAKILTTARRAAASDPALASAVQKQLQNVESLRAAKDRLAASAEKLKTSPEDPAASLAVGSYLCFNRGEWEKGLVLLIRGSDAKLKQLATLELSRPKMADDVIRLADGWWEFAAKQPDLIRVAIRQHAAFFYKLALESETGLRRTVLEHRIAEATVDAPPPGPASGRSIDLLKSLNLETAVLEGQLRFSDRALLTDRMSLVDLGYQPPEEYDFRVQFTRLSEIGNFAQIIAVGQRQGTWIIGGWMNTTCGIDLVDNRRATGNPTTVRFNECLKNGRQCTSILKVRKDSFEAYLDGKLICQWKTDYSGISMTGKTPLKHATTLGISTHGSRFAIQAIEVIEIGGRGTFLQNTEKKRP